MSDPCARWVRSVGAAWLLVIAAVGCTGSSGSPPPDATMNTALSESACLDLERSAQAMVQATVTNNVACKIDGDCANVRFAASCFEACTTVMATAGAAALQAALASVEAAQCVTYHNGGCSFIPPPCRPPIPAICSADGVCAH